MAIVMRTMVGVERIPSGGFIAELGCGHHVLLKSQAKAFPVMECMACPRQWSQYSESCSVCGGSKRSHAANGKCWKCARPPSGDYSDHSQNRRFSVNDRFFDEWNELSAYVYGVLFADGHILKGYRYRIQLAVSDKDESWLRAIRGVMECESPVSYCDIRDKWTPRRAVRFGFSSKRIHAKLIAIGIKRRPPQIADDTIPHFVRGFFDGDGSIFPSGHGSNRMFSNFTGPDWILVWLRDLLSRLVGTANRGPYVKPNTDKVMSLQYAANDTQRLGRFMYQDATLWLPRKRERFSTGEIQ